MNMAKIEKSGYSTINKILQLQALVLVLVSICFLLLGSESMAISSILGGMAAFLPNLYFACRILLFKEKDAKKMLASFYAGETRKILLTGGLFALIFQLPSIQFIPLMACFVAVLSVFWLALLLFASAY